MPAEPARKHALWLMPRGKVREKLLALMTGLSETYRTPPFEPHITLLGGLVSSEDVLAQGTEEIASPAGPLEVELDGMDHAEEYYRCLFAKVREQRSSWSSAGGRGRSSVGPTTRLSRPT